MTWEAAIQGQIGALELDVQLTGDNTPVALIGPNGAGKTTLLRVLAGAYRPANGLVTIGKRVVFDSDRRLELPPEKRSVGYVPQGYGLFPNLCVLDNVAFGLIASGKQSSKAECVQLARVQLERLQCAHLQAALPSELSGGEQQRVALARALIVQPHLLLLDEPLAALDIGARRAVRRFLAAHLAARQRPALIVTHDVRDVLGLEAHVCVMDGGRIVQRGTVAELRAQPANEFVAEFVDA